jgi:hypothetical protein
MLSDNGRVEGLLWRVRVPSSDGTIGRGGDDGLVEVGEDEVRDPIGVVLNALTEVGCGLVREDRGTVSLTSTLVKKR